MKCQSNGTLYSSNPLVWSKWSNAPAKEWFSHRYRAPDGNSAVIVSTGESHQAVTGIARNTRERYSTLPNPVWRLRPTFSIYSAMSAKSRRRDALHFVATPSHKTRPLLPTTSPPPPPPPPSSLLLPLPIHWKTNNYQNGIVSYTKINSLEKCSFYCGILMSKK